MFETPRLVSPAIGHWWARAAFALVLGFLLAQPLAAQDSARENQPQLPPGQNMPPQQQIVERLRQSGLTREQVRQRLQQAGYDPTLADRYFDEMERSESDTTDVAAASRYTRPIPPPSGSLLGALRRIGVLAPGDSIAVSPDTVRPPPRKPEPVDSGPQIFGRELFAATAQFEPIMTGPIDPGYRLGPGDELTLIVTGDVELAYDLQVTREGNIIIPDIGQVLVNGLTLAQARSRLNERLARVYSGIEIGTTQADMTVGRVRSKLVYVIGEVEVPRAYEMTGSATVFSALYRAGGPAVNGSFRNIEVRRDNEVISRVDIYDYLLRGDKSGDVLLEQGDIVFVPVVGPQVTVEGSVRRPAIFELKEGETLIDVMRFAGGPGADAALERIQIDRILPIGERKPGHERVLVDVKLEALVRGAVIPMQNGDHISISKISDMRRSRVTVTGDVRRPGQYEYRVGMTALDLIENAQGLLPSAYQPAAHVVRLNQADNSTSIIRVVLDDPTSADYAAKVILDDLDELSIFGRVALANPEKIEIFGFVKKEGTYEFSEGMSIEDIILMAGGFKEGAEQTMAQVARRNRSGNDRDTLATIYNVPLFMELSGTSSKGSDAEPFQLQDGDQVFIRRAPNYQPLATVEVLGEVTYPGAYTMKARQERITDLVRRAGGLTPEAYAVGLRLFRDGKPVGLDFPKAMEEPGGRDDVTLEPGDRIEIPRLDPTVLVSGAVAFESRVRYEPGLSMEDYIQRAGGALESGNAAKASVRYPNGALRTTSSTLGIRRYPRVEPGSTITVPLRTDKSGFNWDQALGRVMTVLSTLATLLVAANAVK